MAIQHEITQGDWQQWGPLSNLVKAGGTFGEEVAIVHKSADARLVAAAPDLLKALIELRNWVGKLNDWRGDDPPCELVDSALSKANSSSNT